MTAHSPQPVSAAHESDVELAHRAGSGDARAFERLMRRHNRALYRAARSILKDDADAEEAVQDAYVRAYKALPDFRGESALATWLTRIAINQALERLRKRRREPATLPADNVIDLEKHIDMTRRPAAPDTPERALMRDQMRRLVERRIDALPSAFRTVFVLRALEEMSVEDCAACLDIPEATVRTRFFRARRLLRDALASEIDLATEDAFAFAGARCDRIVAAVLARVARQ